MTGFFIANFGKYETCDNYTGYFFFEPLKTYFCNFKIYKAEKINKEKLIIVSKMYTSCIHNVSVV